MSLHTLWTRQSQVQRANSSKGDQDINRATGGPQIWKQIFLCGTELEQLEQVLVVCCSVIANLNPTRGSTSGAKHQVGFFTLG
jgi:hypothetical protein